MHMNMNMLAAYLYKCRLQTLTFKHVHNLNHCLITPLFRSYGTEIITPTTSFSEFRTSFLKNKCGLSGKALITASKYLTFDPSNTRPDSVLEFFRTYGFTQPHITRIISIRPFFLQKFNPENAFKPKLDFLLSMDLSREEVVAIVTQNPNILMRSLDNNIIPLLKLLQSVTGCFRSAITVLKYNPFVLTDDLKSFSLNTDYLLTLGVPRSQILKLLKRYRGIFGKPHGTFCKAVLKLKDMDFDLESPCSVSAIYTLCFVSDSSWDSRCVVFRSFGFSNDEILFMFKKLPSIMCLKEETINKKLEFFFNKLHWKLYRLLSTPAVLSYSLEQRIIPRCSVLEVLVSVNSTSDSFMLSTILNMPDRRFVKEFVTAHKDVVPEVMEAYEGKLTFDEYTFKLKGDS